MFLVYLGVILGHIVSDAKKLPNSKKILTIVNMHASKMPKDIGFQWDGLVLLMLHQELCLHHGPHHETFTQIQGVCMDCRMSKSMGGCKVKVFGCTNYSYNQMVHGVTTKLGLL
jgi:hypothetical protein